VIPCKDSNEGPRFIVGMDEIWAILSFYRPVYLGLVRIMLGVMIRDMIIIRNNVTISVRASNEKLGPFLTVGSLMTALSKCIML